MPKVSTTVKATTTVKAEVKLTPAVRKRLLNLGEAWEVANAVAKKAEADKKDATSAVDRVLSDAGEFKALEEGIEVGRYKMKYVASTRTFIDEDKLRKFLTPQQIEDCRTTTPGTPYVKISAGRE
jgi:protein subunit release factor B